MPTIGLFYASSTGNTRRVAKTIHKSLPVGCVTEAINVNKANCDMIVAYPNLIFGTSTLGGGQLPGLATGCMGGGWEELLPKIEHLDFKGKKVALFGLGDQQKYPDMFVDAMGTLYHFLIKRNAQVIGRWPVENYAFDASTAIVEHQFVGLALDQENQKELTATRLERWLQLIKPEFAG